MAEILGSLRINHERAIGDLTLEADQGHGLEEGHEVGVAGAAAVDLEASQKVAPDPGLGAKVDHVLDQKAGNLDQKANLFFHVCTWPLLQEESPENGGTQEFDLWPNLMKK